MEKEYTYKMPKQPTKGLYDMNQYPMGQPMYGPGMCGMNQPYYGMDMMPQEMPYGMPKMEDKNVPGYPMGMENIPYQYPMQGACMTGQCGMPQPMMPYEMHGGYPMGPQEIPGYPMGMEDFGMPYQYPMQGQCMSGQCGMPQPMMPPQTPPIAPTPRMRPFRRF